MKTKLFNRLLVASMFLSSLAFTLYAQSSPPESISYQGIARDASGNILSNQPIGIQFIIHQGVATGSVVFSESHSTTTNTLGLFSLQIGSVNTATFQTIPWQNGPYYLEVQMDPTGGTSYTSIGTQQMLSVPYALYSKRSAIADSLSIPFTGPFPLWKTKGNYGINPSQHFLGTLDTSSLIFKTNNTKRMLINSQGKVTIGNASLSNPALFNVIGASLDTVLAAFVGFNSFGSAIAIYNPNSIAGILALNNQDTVSLAVQSQPNNSTLYATDNLLVGSRDTLFLTGDTKIEIGSGKDIYIYSPDSVDIVSKTNINYSTPSSGNNNNALTVNFFNNSGYSSGLKINHSAYLSNSMVSHGIYIDNFDWGIGDMVGMGSYFNSGGNSNKRGIDVYVGNGGGTNIAAFLHSATGGSLMNGYSNWSIYSNAGNIMIKDGHIVSSVTTLAPTVSSTIMTGGSLFVTFDPLSTATDTKGIINYTISATTNGTISVTFGIPYFKKPTVVFSYSGGGASVQLNSVSTTGFILNITNSFAGTSVGEIHYMIIE